MKEHSLKNYTGSIPDILRYQLITKLILVALTWSVRLARSAVIWTTSRGEVITGDVKYWLTSVQGWIVISVTLFLLIMYVIYDFNATIILSQKLIHQEKVSVRKILLEALQSVRHFRGPFGWFIMVYAALLIPLAGVGMGISLTNGFYIPKFILSFLEKRPMIQSIYSVVLVILLAVSLYFIFTFHCMVLGHMKAGPAILRAGRMMRQNWKGFWVRFLSFFARSFVSGALKTAALIGVLFVLGNLISFENELYYKIFITAITLFSIAAAVLFILLFVPFLMIELTILYESYSWEDEGEIKYPDPRPRKGMIIACIGMVFVIAGASVWSGLHFDEAFPSMENTIVVSHRTGGNLAGENTLTGLERAIEAGADSTEIDIQRAADGEYIVNHDNTFKRLTGDDHYVDELTVEEIKDLRLKGKYTKGEEETIATFREILEASKDKIHVYIELKGKTADFRMASDAYWIVAEYDMLDQVTFISMKYSVVSYLESKHPDADTGYLCYSAFGDIEQLKVDGLYLEEEMATPVTISRIHKAGKKAFVWTVNDTFSMLRYYARNADGIITDSVRSAVSLQDFLQVNNVGERYVKQAEYMIRIVLRVIFEYWP